MEPTPSGRTVLSAALAWAALAAVACEPMGPIPGGRLSGDEVSEPVADWSFSDPHDTIQLETRPADPHSVTVWCASVEGRLYIPTRDPEKKRWVEYVASEPRVRVRIGDKVYPASAVRVTDPTEFDSVVPVLIRKYDLDPPEGDEKMDVWIFRIESQGAEG